MAGPVIGPMTLSTRPRPRFVLPDSMAEYLSQYFEFREMASFQDEFAQSTNRITLRVPVLQHVTSADRTNGACAQAR